MTARGRTVAILVATLVVAFIAGIALVLSPASPITRAWRARQQELGANVIVGPYPEEADLRRLKRDGVTTIVSLLDPRLPYERILLQRETKTARSLGLAIANYPMTSVLGRRFGSPNDANAAAAAEFAQRSRGRVYLHCYLGIHRVKSVTDLLRGRLAVASYTARAGERSRDQRLLDAAQQRYEAADYDAALAIVRDIRTASPAADTLRGWAALHTNRLEESSVAFAHASAAAPQQSSAIAGLGYVALRQDDLARARLLFDRALALNTGDGDALSGAGIVAYRQARTEDARSLIDRALAIDPQNREILAMREKLSPQR